MKMKKKIGMNLAGSPIVELPPPPVQPGGGEGEFPPPGVRPVEPSAHRVYRQCLGPGGGKVRVRCGKYL